MDGTVVRYPKSDSGCIGAWPHVCHLGTWFLVWEPKGCQGKGQHSAGGLGCRAGCLFLMCCRTLIIYVLAYFREKNCPSVGGLFIRPLPLGRGVRVLLPLHLGKRAPDFNTRPLTRMGQGSTWGSVLRRGSGCRFARFRRQRCWRWWVRSRCRAS